MTINSPSQVKEYYQQQHVATRYIRKRFTEVLNVIEHQRQVTLLNTIIRTKHCTKVLEFAPGPARVTTEIIAKKGTSIDSSASMISIAKTRMKAKNKLWNFVHADILTMKLKPKHDLVFCLRFLLHFKEKERQAIYAQAGSALQPGGYLAFEAMNTKVVLPLRKLLGMKRYIVYDKLYTKGKLIQELEHNGFSVIALYPILNHFWLQALLTRPLTLLGWRKMALKVAYVLEQFPTHNPYEWLVLCQKKDLFPNR